MATHAARNTLTAQTWTRIVQLGAGDSVSIANNGDFMIRISFVDTDASAPGSSAGYYEIPPHEAHVYDDPDGADVYAYAHVDQDVSVRSSS